ncbi:hypothetical protein DOS81_07130 [Staphylococcus felis]|uniref:DUF4135 domain-containing protein n=1 Tax=Staphylococcus felis TaxID=46127 RepID=UPI000E271F78|nr:DUF4135 domain-containing protein [Staphylococcus felis]REI29279.1 hypothetical protein DOS81_07130 [Staphylococcus felis]
MRSCIELYDKYLNKSQQKKITIESFVEPFSQFVVDKISSEYKLNDKFKKSIKINTSKEILSYFSKVLITEANVYKLEHNIDSLIFSEYFEYITQKNNFQKLHNLYPFLFNFLMNRCDLIINSYILCLNNYNNDKEILKEKGLIQNNEELIYIERNVGDSHSNGNTVMKLHFTKSTLFYKPQSSKLTKKLFEIQNWISQRSDIDFHRYKIANFCNHAYEESVTHELCKNEEDLINYYYNIGVITGMIYLFNGTDYHYENIIAHGRFPVLIDNETLFDPKLINRTIYDHLKNSSLFPSPNIKIDISGLSGCFSSQKIKSEQLKKIGDSYVLETSEVMLKRMNNIPIDKIDFNYIYKHKIEEIKRGFEDLLTVFLENKEDFLKSKIFKSLKHERARFLYRETMFYSQLLLTGTHPYHIKTKELFTKFLIKNITKTSKTKLIDKEIEQLLNGDIPIFSIDLNKNYINENENIKFESTPFDYIYKKIVNLNKKNIEQGKLDIDKIFYEYKEVINSD